MFSKQNKNTGRLTFKGTVKTNNLILKGYIHA